MSEELKRSIVQAMKRLRLVQAGFADEDGERQQDYLGGELDEMLKTVPSAEQPAFLEGLLEECSSPGQADAAVGPTRTSPPVGGPPDPDTLLAALEQALPALSEAQRCNLLRIVGLTAHSSGTAAASDQAIKRLRDLLQTRGDGALHEDRIVELAGLLLDFVLKLEPLVVGVWGKVSPRSNIRPSRNFRKAAGSFLEEEAVPFTTVSQELAALLQFITAVVAGISHAGDEFANRWSGILSPQAISTVAEMKKGGLLKTREAKCWEQYCIQAEEHLSRDSIEKEIREAIGRHAETVLKGLGRMG